MNADYKITLATPEDIPEIVALQDPNVIDRGGGLSVRQTPDWFDRSMREMPVIVARRDGKLIGYVLSTSLAAKAHVPVVQAMLRSFPPPPDCYLYGPVCVDAAERGRGLAGAMFDALRAHLPGKPAMTFIRADNVPSLRAHKKMGMRELGSFKTEGVSHIALTYAG
ncbi:MAG TPA: GNAT family N-acetyltransferase [Candidatus Binatia bacterium]|nr:GNAT family N-acetyltransferase [Candidatus Binatia bacterium]